MDFTSFVISSGMAVAYVVMFFLFPYLFTHKKPNARHLSSLSILCIFFASIASYLLAMLIPNEFWSNRFLHTFGGGFLAFLTCFLAARDSRAHLRTEQFFFLSFLVVIALGNLNEVFEFVLQNTMNLQFATNINDTWLDLSCNITGALLAGTIFTPSIKHTKHE